MRSIRPRHSGSKSSRRPSQKTVCRRHASEQTELARSQRIATCCVPIGSQRPAAYVRAAKRQTANCPPRSVRNEHRIEVARPHSKPVLVRASAKSIADEARAEAVRWNCHCERRHVATWANLRREPKSLRTMTPRNSATYERTFDSILIGGVASFSADIKSPFADE